MHSENALKFGVQKAAVGLQFVIGLVFIYSGLQKLSDMNTFLAIVKDYRLIPAPLDAVAAFALPWIEFGLGSTLFLGVFVKFSALSIASLLLVFISGIAINLIRGNDFSCGCFSLSLVKDSAQKAVLWIGRNMALIIACSIVFYFDGKSPNKK